MEEQRVKLWIDDVRPAPEGYIWIKSVNGAKKVFIDYEMYCNGSLDELDFDWLDFLTYNDPNTIELIDIDHDAGDYTSNGGDYIKLLDWLEETGRNYPIRIHSQNVVGRMNMEAICRRNGWTIVK